MRHLEHTKIVALSTVFLCMLGAEPNAYANERNISVEIVTEIRPNDLQAGVKSHHTLVIDTAKKSVISKFETGKTNLKVAEINSIRDAFSIPQKDFIGSLVHIQAKGETASGVGILGSIDYHLTMRINTAQRKVWISGTHNEYPSYVVKVNGKVVYDRRQTGSPLIGLVDTLSTVDVGVEAAAF
jgi:hypothetical protein